MSVGNTKVTDCSILSSPVAPTEQLSTVLSFHPLICLCLLFQSLLFLTLLPSTPDFVCVSMLWVV